MPTKLRDPYHDINLEFLKKRVNYDSSGNAIKVGYALPGVADDDITLDPDANIDAGWSIFENEYADSKLTIRNPYFNINDNGFIHPWRKSLVAWFDAERGVELNGIGVDLIDEDFSSDPGWTEVGTGLTVANGQLTVVTTGDQDSLEETIASSTELWASFDLTLGSGLSLDSGETARLFTFYRSNGINNIVGVGLKNDGGVLKWWLEDRVFGSVRSRVIASPLPVFDISKKITMHWRMAPSSSPNDGAFEVWLDDTVIFSEIDIDNDGIWNIAILKLGNIAPNTLNAIFTFDNVKVGTTGVHPGAVEKWKDQSGNGNHLLQTVAVDQPQLITSGAKPLIRFNGISEFLQTLAFSSALSFPNTIILVGRHVDTVATQYIFTGTTSEHSLRIISANRYQIAASGGVNQGGTANTTRGNLTTIWNTVSKVYKDGGSPVLSGNPSSGSLDGLTVGANIDGDSPAALEVNDVLIFSRLLTDEEINEIGNNFADKHSLTWTDIS